MLNCKAIGSEMVLAYVLPRYCRERHNVSDETQRKRLAVFAGDVKRKRKKQNVDKEQKDMLELLAAGVTRMNVDEDAVEAMKGIAGTTTSRYPPLLCGEQDRTLWKSDKTGGRKWLKARYSDAFPDVLHVAFTSDIFTIFSFHFLRYHLVAVVIMFFVLLF